MLCCYSRLA